MAGGICARRVVERRKMMVAPASASLTRMSRRKAAAAWARQ